MPEPKKPVIDEVVIAINNALGVSERDPEASKKLQHFLRWYTTDEAAAPRRVEVTLTGVLKTEHFQRVLTLPGGEKIDFELHPDTEGIKIKDLG